MIFNLFVGVVVIGASLRRRVYVNRGIYNLYPDVRVVLIAPTGKGKKTTSINQGRKLIEASKITRILSEIVTPEALCDALSSGKVVMKGGEIREEEQDAVGLLILPELSVFLDKRDYKSGLVPLLTRLGDAPDYLPSSTISRGQKPLKNVALTVMAGSAKSWLTDSIPVDAFRGGFMSRFLFVVSEGMAHPVSKPPKMNRDMETALVKGLQAFARLEGEIEMLPEAEAFFDKWYNEAYFKRSLDEKRAAYQERKHDHVLRLSMILAVSQYRTQINENDVENALGLFNYIEEEMFSLFGEIERGTTPQGESLQMVLSFIKKRGKVSRTEVLRRVISKGITASVVDELILSLEAGGYIRKEKVKGDGVKSTTIYTYQGEDLT